MDDSEGEERGGAKERWMEGGGEGVNSFAVFAAIVGKLQGNREEV